jgi:predicted DNA-binding transcriptional regulator AlpA
MVEPLYMTTAEVADLCRTSPETVRYWRHVGKGPRSFKLGRKVLYASSEVRTWIERVQSAEYEPVS